MSAPAAQVDRGEEGAVLAAALLAIDPHGLGGAMLGANDPEAAARWVAMLGQLLPTGAPVRRLPGHVSDDRLLGGIDLAATLAAGRRVAGQGILGEADGGVIVVPGADRLTTARVAHLVAALDTGTVIVEREGVSARPAARFGLVAMDDGLGDGLAPALADRLAFVVGLDRADATATSGHAPADLAGLAAAVDRARARSPADVPGGLVDGLARAAIACGIVSLRIVILAVRCARVHAALRGRAVADERDAEAAAQLVLGPRMIMLPEAPEEAQSQEPSVDPEPDVQGTDEQPRGRMEDRLLEAVTARLPADLLADLKARTGRSPAAAPRRSGRRAPSRKPSARGRQLGSRKAVGRACSRLDLVATLRAAAPWQALRRSEVSSGRDDEAEARSHQSSAVFAAGPLVQIRREDFHVKRLRHTPVSVTIFVVDASGSSALNRLAEAKGAVELLLADCYVRRDEVALIAFRGTSAEVLLPPTRSLVRAKRRLAGLPGGGATPLAAGLEAATQLAQTITRRGHVPIIVLLTDGRANMSRDGTPGRAQAEQDAIAAARHRAWLGASALVIDTSPRPEPQAARIAEAMAARYLPLPHADARVVTGAVLAAARTGDRKVPA